MSAQLELQWEIEQFLYREAELLDSHRLEEWGNLFTEDCLYRMPTRETSPDNPAGFPKDDEAAVRNFDDDMFGLKARLLRLTSSTAHAEIPVSRIRHNISNVRVGTLENEEVPVRSNFFLFQSRRENAETFYVGERHDRLRRVEGKWRIARRTILLDHNIQPRSLSIFF